MQKSAQLIRLLFSQLTLGVEVDLPFQNIRHMFLFLKFLATFVLLYVINWLLKQFSQCKLVVIFGPPINFLVVFKLYIVFIDTNFWAL